MLRRDIDQRFAEKKRCSEDYQLWLEICCAGLACYKNELPLAYTFKADYGDAGLSAALWQMQKGQLDSYRNIYELGYVRSDQLMLLYIWSFLRFFRRATKTFFRDFI